MFTWHCGADRTYDLLRRVSVVSRDVFNLLKSNKFIANKNGTFILHMSFDSDFKKSNFNTCLLNLVLKSANRLKTIM
jgi:hypothetical protein